MSVKVVCTTNIDSWKFVKWPTVLAGVPNKGDYIEALEPAFINTKMQDSGDIVSKKVERPTLKVVGVTHIGSVEECVVKGPPVNRHHFGPYVLVELHHEHAVQLGWLY